MSGGSRRRSESLVSVTFCDNICRGPGFCARPAGLEIGFDLIQRLQLAAGTSIPYS